MDELNEQIYLSIEEVLSDVIEKYHPNIERLKAREELKLNILKEQLTELIINL